MGDFTSNPNDSDSLIDYSSVSRLASIVLLILGLFSPLLYSSYGQYSYYYISVQSIFWNYTISAWENGFSFVQIWMLFSMFPFVILRMVPVVQIHRYYQGKTTRKRTFLIVLVGDIYFIAGSILMLIMTFMFPTYYLVLPLPFQTLAGWLFLIVYRIREPVSPWESVDETNQWWDEKKESMPEVKDIEDDKDKLW